MNTPIPGSPVGRHKGGGRRRRTRDWQLLRARVKTAGVRVLASVVAAGLLVPMVGGAAHATTGLPVGPTFTVTGNGASIFSAVGDANPGDGVCANAAGVCTLRAAIEEVNALGGSQGRPQINVAMNRPRFSAAPMRLEPAG